MFDLSGKPGLYQAVRLVRRDKDAISVRNAEPINIHRQAMNIWQRKADLLDYSEPFQHSLAHCI
jgi:hypothetical protein